MDDPEGHRLDRRNLLLMEAERRVGGRVNVEIRYFISSHPPTRGICWPL